ncbi:MAG: GerW family sporulation protein [Bacillota bacterium]
MSHPIENIMKTTMEQIKEMVDVNTIIGSPIMTSKETMVLPVSRVSLGFLSGGGEYGRVAPVHRSADAVRVDEERYPFAGVSVAGMSLTPMAFLSVSEGCVKVLPAHYNCTLDRIIEMVPHSLMEIEKMICKAMDGKKGCASEEEKDGAHEDYASDSAEYA